MRRIVIFAAAASLAATAHAQTAAPAAADGLGGPVVPGVCLMSRQAVLTNTKVGQAATARLRALTDEAQKEIEADRKPIEAEIEKYNVEAAKLSTDQQKARQQVLTARMQPVDAKANLRAREIEATRAKAVERITAVFQPVLAQAYRQRNCGLLVDRSSVIGGNLANDLTQAVVQGLDAKISTITFNRESLVAASGGAPSGGSH